MAYKPYYTQTSVVAKTSVWMPFREQLREEWMLSQRIPCLLSSGNIYFSPYLVCDTVRNTHTSSGALHTTD